MHIICAFQSCFLFLLKLSLNPAMRKTIGLCFVFALVFMFCACPLISCFSVRMLYSLGLIWLKLDSELTKYDVDSNGAVSHKICAHGPTRSSRLHLESLRAAMEGSYRVSKKFCEFRPILSNWFLKDQDFTIFGVFANKSFG